MTSPRCGEKSGIRVLDVGVNWRDGYANDPDLCFLLDRAPEWGVYDKRPCQEESLSSEQVLIVGSRLRRKREGWHLYWSTDGDFAWFFTWGGKPDDGFGGWRRTITLSDGSTEEIVGGWHVGSDTAHEVGHPRVVECAYRTDYFTARDGSQQLGGGTVCFVTEERFRHEVEAHLPDCEIATDRAGQLTVKWRGAPSKAEFMAAESTRRDVIRERAKARSAGKWDWYQHLTAEENAELECRSYSTVRETAAK